MESRQTISEETKNKIAKLADQGFVEQLLNENLKKYYSDFQKIKSLELTPYKQHLGQTSAVFVIGYQLVYLTDDDQEVKLHLFATGHSDGSRKAAYQKLGFLYEHGFDQGKFQATRPLFFTEGQQGFFYEASEGQNLFNFFIDHTEVDLKNILSLAAGWINKLHNLAAVDDFNWPQFNIADMVPSLQQFLLDFSAKDPKQGAQVKRIINTMQQYQQRFNKEHAMTLIYGDYHPENIIVENLETDYLKMIDFTDIAIGDSMVDLGSFLQQFDFMGHKFFPRSKINADKEYFLTTYFQKDLDKIDAHFFQRINLYQAWTALRTAVFLFYMHEDHSVADLLVETEKYLDLIEQGEKKINLH